MKFAIYSYLNNQKMQFAQEVDAPTEEEACTKALVVMGLSYEATKKKTPKITWKELLYQNALFVKPVK